MEFPKPRVVVSRCIEFDRVRFNGEMISSDFVRELRPHIEAIPVCPEVEVGLGVPRESLRLVANGDDVRLVQPATARDLTNEMRAWAGAFLDGLSEVDGFILKSRSPSSGIRDVKVYRSADGPIVLSGRNAGVFGGAVLERFGHLAVEDEARLLNLRIREHFLTKLYTLARFRAIGARPKMRDLVRFQAENKLLLMTYSQGELGRLGRIVANRERLRPEHAAGAYRAHLRAALARAPRPSSHINVLMHALGYFKQGLSAEEKAFFLHRLEDYRRGVLPLSVPLALVRAWALRFGERYLLQQTYLEPFPAELVGVERLAPARDYWK